MVYSALAFCMFAAAQSQSRELLSRQLGSKVEAACSMHLFSPSCVYCQDQRMDRSTAYANGCDIEESAHQFVLNSDGFAKEEKGCIGMTQNHIKVAADATCGDSSLSMIFKNTAAKDSTDCENAGMMKDDTNTRWTITFADAQRMANKECFKFGVWRNLESVGGSVEEGVHYMKCSTYSGEAFCSSESSSEGRRRRSRSSSSANAATFNSGRACIADGDCDDKDDCSGNGKAECGRDGLCVCSCDDGWRDKDDCSDKNDRSSDATGSCVMLSVAVVVSAMLH